MEECYKLVRPGKMVGCQTLYEITPENETNVGDFVKAAIDNKREWGYIVVKKEHCTKELARIEYRYGKIIENCDPNVLTSKVIKGDLVTGWTNTDFTLIVPRDEEYTNKEVLEMLDDLLKETKLLLNNRKTLVKDSKERDGYDKAMDLALFVIENKINGLEN